MYACFKFCCAPLTDIYRLVAIAKGEQEYFDDSGIATATEAAKSNALMRCCKDLGIASELWSAFSVLAAVKSYLVFLRDPRFIREFKAKTCVEVFAEHLPTKKKYVQVCGTLCSISFYALGRNFGVGRTNPSFRIHIKSK